MRDWIVSLSLLTLAFVPTPAMAQERPWEWGMHPGWWMWGVGGVVMPLMMLVFWGLVIAGGVFGLRWLVRQGREEPPDRALAILRERADLGGVPNEERVPQVPHERVKSARVARAFDRHRHRRPKACVEPHDLLAVVPEPQVFAFTGSGVEDRDGLLPRVQGYPHERHGCRPS